MQPQMALRNTAGVILPLIAGYALGMPRGGLAMASGAQMFPIRMETIPTRNAQSAWWLPPYGAPSPYCLEV